MVLATPHDSNCPLPISCWYDVPGSVSEKQYVPAQGGELIKKVEELLKKMESPDLYVISPFREVVRQLQSLFFKNKKIEEIFKTRFKNFTYSKWIREAVGTVHTFQGKQASAVFFVLGGDLTTLGSVEWASRKPNLLNVAVTRACLRFYIIGDHKLWHKWPYFDIAAQKLQKVS